MKTKRIYFILLAVLIFTIAKLQAQDYQIDFAGTGASTTVDSVQVQNLTKGTSLTLNGSDILHLTSTTGIKTATIGGKTLGIYPNPMTSNCTIEFEVAEAGVVSIDLFDITGKKVSSVQNNLPSGLHTYTINGLKSGVYTISIKTDNENFASKIISSSKNAGTATINYINSTEPTTDYTNSTVESSETPTLRSAQTTIDMPYTTGDRILLKGMSSIYSTLISLVPIANSTQTFNFVAASDCDGNNYTTVTIGTQTWMVENLKTTKYNDCTSIPIITDLPAWGALTTGACCNYSNDTANAIIYGKLYNWYALSNGKLAPAGWHVPSKAEWDTLRTYLFANLGTFGSIAKALAAKTDWVASINAGAPGNDLSKNNSIGFSAVPGGFRNGYEGTFSFVGRSADWWSSTEDSDPLGAYYRRLDFNNYDLYYSYAYKGLGMSVRCIKD